MRAYDEADNEIAVTSHTINNGNVDSSTPSGLRISPDGWVLSGVVKSGHTVQINYSGNVLDSFFVAGSGEETAWSVRLPYRPTPGTVIYARAISTAGVNGGLKPLTIPSDVGDDPAPACSSDELVPGVLYSRPCGLEDVGYGVYYAGEWNGEPIFLTSRVGSSYKHLGAIDRSDDGYANTIDNVDNKAPVTLRFGSYTSLRYGSYECLTLAGTGGSEHGFFLPSLEQLQPFWNGIIDRQFARTKMGMVYDSSVKMLISDHATQYGSGWMGNSADGSRQFDVSPGFGPMFCAITPSSIEAAKLR